jgi:catechol 2,3-dioxygenase
VHLQALGHVVLKTQDARRAEAFYGGVLGIPVVGRVTDPVPMTFFTLGHHHDFAVMELGAHGRSPDRYATGLGHVAFKVGDSLDELASVQRELEAAGVVVLFALDHVVTRGIHVHDPDGNEVELYVDLPEARAASR